MEYFKIRNFKFFFIQIEKHRRTWWVGHVARIEFIKSVAGELCWEKNHFVDNGDGRMALSLI